MKIIYSEDSVKYHILPTEKSDAYRKPVVFVECFGPRATSLRRPLPPS